MAETGQALKKRLTRATLRHLRPGPEMEPAHDAGGGPSNPNQEGERAGEASELGLIHSFRTELCIREGVVPSIDEIRQKIRNNFPKEAQSRRETPLLWNRETMHTITSECGTYRVSRMEDPHNPGVFGYALSLSATPTAAPKHLAGPYFTPKEAREAAQRHKDGIPLQADLA